MFRGRNRGIVVGNAQRELLEWLVEQRERSDHDRSRLLLTDRNRAYGAAHLCPPDFCCQCVCDQIRAHLALYALAFATSFTLCCCKAAGSASPLVIVLLFTRALPHDAVHSHAGILEGLAHYGFLT